MTFPSSIGIVIGRLKYKRSVWFFFKGFAPRLKETWLLYHYPKSYTASLSEAMYKSNASFFKLACVSVCVVIIVYDF